MVKPSTKKVFSTFGKLLLSKPTLEGILFVTSAIILAFGDLVFPLREIVLSIFVVVTTLLMLKVKRNIGSSNGDD